MTLTQPIETRDFRNGEAAKGQKLAAQAWLHCSLDIGVKLTILIIGYFSSFLIIELSIKGGEWHILSLFKLLQNYPKLDL